MMLKRTRTAGMAAALVGGALLLAGCGGQAATNSATAPGASGTEAAPSNGTDSAPAQNSGDQASGTNDGISGSDCSAEDFTITMQAQPGGDKFLLEMKNTSDQSCQVGGWAVLTPMNMANQPTDAKTDTISHPGPPKEITLEPGRSVFSGVKLELGDKSDPDAQVASGFTAEPTDMQGKVNVDLKDLNGGDEPMELPIKSLQVGTLQPSPQGVVAF